MRSATLFLTLHGFLVGILLYRKPFDVTVVAMLTSALLMAMYGMSRYNEGVEAGKRQAGRDLRP